MPTPDSKDAYSKAVKGGEVVFTAGDAGSDLFIIEEGRVELSVAQPPRTYTLEVGDFFGERALATTSATPRRRRSPPAAS